MRRTIVSTVIVGTVVVGTAVLVGAGPALACGGLIGRNGAVNLERTTTLAAYKNGVEHYVTAFEFNGAGGEFGSIVPLPGVPTKVERGGDWTLQRLQREIAPPAPEFAGAARVATQLADKAEVILETQIDALDITVLEGGGRAVGTWAKDNGFLLPPDSPEVLDFYAKRSPIFMATRFDGTRAAARGTAIGDGTPIHLTIPTPNPWVPLRILALGQQPDQPVQADVFLLTDGRPALLPAGNNAGFQLDRSEPASTSLLDDLRSDKSMEWIPSSMWLSYLKIDTPARNLRYDLAVDVNGGAPSPRAAGLPSALLPPVVSKTDVSGALAVSLLVAAGVLLAGAYAVGRTGRSAPAAG
jgi:hypothetical protein